MRRSLVTLLCLCLPAVAGAVDIEEEVRESRAAVAAFGAALQEALLGAMGEGGPVAAIEVCNLEAPAIAVRLSQAHDLEIARTSLKVRNPGNAPDAWESAVLESFDQRNRRGEAASGIEHAEIVPGPAGETFRYMKAIPTGGVCVVCHGAEIDPDLAAAIDALYPEDQARGYAEGDIRGAFSIRRQM